MPTTKRPPSRERLPARDRLLATATELFTTRGYAATSVREIVEGAGVTKPILYHHFGSKEGIFQALIQKMEHELEQMLLTVRSERGGALARIRALCHAVQLTVEDFRPEVRLLHALYYGPEQGTPEVSLLDFPCKIESAIGDIVRDGIRSGELRRGDVRTMTLALQGILSITVETHLSEHLDSLDRDGVDRLLDVIFRGLAAPARVSRKRTKESAR
jgi:AcrR family transcriptional regulator